MFFDQIKDIDGSIKQLKTDMVGIGKSAEAHYDHLDDIAAHIIALEAIVVALIRSNGIDADDVRNWVKHTTAECSGNPDGSEKARVIMNELLDQISQ